MGAERVPVRDLERAHAALVPAQHGLELAHVDRRVGPVGDDKGGIPEVLEQAFGRAFELLDASGDKLDKNKVEKFEADWAKYMQFANLTVDTAEKTK